MSSVTTTSSPRRGSLGRHTALLLLPLLLLPALLSSPLAAQGSAGSSSRLEPRFLVDMPSAGMLDRGSFGVDVDFYQSGGILLGFSVGVFDRLSGGISYGGSGLIGPDTPEMNPVPGFNVRLRLLEESVAFPALALGFDSQGKDGYLRDLDRYAIKSPGFFAVVSKNYALAGFFSLHLGVNYTLERADGDRGLNAYGGLEKTVCSIVSAVVEYNLGLNDNAESAVGSGKGYLNAALRLSPGGGTTVALLFKDILKNSQLSTGANRAVSLEFCRSF